MEGGARDHDQAGRGHHRQGQRGEAHPQLLRQQLPRALGRIVVPRHSSIVVKAYRVRTQQGPTSILGIVAKVMSKNAIRLRISPFFRKFTLWDHRLN